MNYIKTILFILAFSVLTAAGQNITCALETLDIETGERTVIREFDYKIEAPNWADGSNQIQMTFDQGYNACFPHVSPDGENVVYLVYDAADVDPGDHPPAYHCHPFWGTGHDKCQLMVT